MHQQDGKRPDLMHVEKNPLFGEAECECTGEENTPLKMYFTAKKPDCELYLMSKHQLMGYVKQKDIPEEVATELWNTESDGKTWCTIMRMEEAHSFLAEECGIESDIIRHTLISEAAQSRMHGW